MKKEVKDFKRKDLFDLYNERSNPFLAVTTRIDVTNIVNYCKKHKYYYATMGYFILSVVNEMKCFKLRAENGKIYEYDTVIGNFTQMFDEDNIGFFECDKTTSYKTFIEEFKKIQDEFYEKQKSIYKDMEGSVWFSCAPWFEFSSLMVPFDKSLTQPQFIWGKFVNENDRWYTNMMIMVHHGFADGSHIAKFLNNLNDKIARFDEIINKEV